MTISILVSESFYTDRITIKVPIKQMPIWAYFFIKCHRRKIGRIFVYFWFGLLTRTPKRSRENSTSERHYNSEHGMQITAYSQVMFWRRFLVGSVLCATTTVQSPADYYIFANFRKNTAKNTTKPENIPELLHFFDIFCNSPGVSTVVG